MNNGLPIFITGFERSGTTLLRRIISMHPALEYELIHEKKRLLKYKTAEDAVENYRMSVLQGGKITGATASIVSGEKIPYRDDLVFIMKYVERWKEFWPDAIIIHIDRDVEAMAKSAKRVFNRNVEETIRTAWENVYKVKRFLDTHTNVIWVAYENILANPYYFVKNLYSVMGDFNENDNYIHKVVTNKETWEYKGRVMCGLRYANGIKRLNNYDV